MVLACFISLRFIFLYKNFSRPLWCFCFQASILCMLLKFFTQNSRTPSDPGSFQFAIFFNIFSFFCEICTCACSFFPSVSVLYSLNQVASLCSTSWPQIYVHNVFASCASGITISSPSSPCSLLLILYY